VPLKDRINEDLKRAMLDKDVLTRDALRMAKSELTAKENEVGRDLTEDEELAVLQKAVKSREDTARQYDDGGRPEAAEQERAEIGVLSRYLPQPLTEDETRQAALEAAQTLGLSGKKDLGKLMKELKARHGASLDGKLASRIGGEVLEGL
jgi:hypothetical protein